MTKNHMWHQSLSKIRRNGFAILIVAMLLPLAACQNRAALHGLDKNKTYGEMGVYSNPPRAMIIVDDYNLVKTPAIVAGVEVGRPYHVKIMREGYQPWEQNIVLREKRENLHINLKP